MVELVEKAVGKELRDAGCGALMHDAWTKVDVHYIGIFACYMRDIKMTHDYQPYQPYQLQLLARNELHAVELHFQLLWPRKFRLQLLFSSNCNQQQLTASNPWAVLTRLVGALVDWPTCYIAPFTRGLRRDADLCTVLPAAYIANRDRTGANGQWGSLFYS